MSCCAVNCVERSSRNSGISFFTFPKDPELRRKWLVAMKRDCFDTNHKAWMPSPFSRLCSKHFSYDDLDSSSPFRKKLKADAVPSIFSWTEEVKKRCDLKNDLPSVVISEHNNERSMKKIENETIVKIEVLRTEQVGIINDYIKTLEVKDETLKSREQLISSQNEEIEKLKRKLSKKSLIILRQRKKLKRLNTSTAYYRKKLSSMKTLLDELKQKNVILEVRKTYIGNSFIPS